MTVKELLVADLQATLEETANLMADRIILESLAKHGKITLEEAEFYDSLVRRVVTEAAEEFVPEELPIQEAAEPMILTGEDGTVYQFNPATCELTPIEGTGGAEDNPSVEDMGEGADIEEPEMEDELKESEEVSDETKEELTESETAEETAEETKEQIEESETTEEPKEELTESQMIVANLIKSLGA
jgi:hypothetical protein